MAREILFRGKRIDNGGWVFGNHLYDNTFGKHYIVLSRHITYIYIAVNPDGEFKRLRCTGIEVVPETVGQYTGLTDKDGKKIFEGDIFKHRQFDYPDTFGVVKYRNNYDQYRVHNCCGFAIEWQNTSIDRNLREDLPFWCDEISNAEIVGNIYDNPELLEVK